MSKYQKYGGAEYAREYLYRTMYRKVKPHKTECLCPRCGESHEQNTYFVGKEPYKKFCDICFWIASNDYSDGYGMGYPTRKGIKRINRRVVGVRE